MNILSNYREVLDTPIRRRVILAIGVNYLMVQVASFPVALSLPSIAEDFNVSISTAAWVLIAEMLALGSTVFLAARLGDRYGDKEVFFLGVVITTFGAVAAGFSQSFTQLILFRGFQGIGAAMVTGNANALLAGVFPPNQRGRAYALPITAARVGTFIGLIVFAVFLHFIGWRAVFFSFIPLGIAALGVSIPLMRQKKVRDYNSSVPLDYVGPILLIGTVGALILSGVHLHAGEESFTSSDALRYHLPMHITFLVLLLAFVLIERRMAHPFMDFRLFRHKYFSLALISNGTFHLSMLAIMTLVPIMVEEGFGYDPLFVIYILLPHQSLGLFIPIIAGWYYDKYNPKLLRPVAMSLIALGILLVGMFSLRVPFWYIPLLLFPASIGTAIFNTINNAVIMNSIPQEHRGFASGMIETTRHVGHTLGATIAASILGLVLPATILTLSDSEAHGHYMRGFQISAIAVTWIIVLGAVLAFQHRTPRISTVSVVPETAASSDES